MPSSDPQTCRLNLTILYNSTSTCPLTGSEKTDLKRGPGSQNCLILLGCCSSGAPLSVDSEQPNLSSEGELVYGRLFSSTCSSEWKMSGREGWQIWMARVRWEGSRGRREGREMGEINWRSCGKQTNSEARSAAWKDS